MRILSILLFLMTCAFAQEWKPESSDFLTRSSQKYLQSLQTTEKSEYDSLCRAIARVEDLYHGAFQESYALAESDPVIPKNIHFLWMGPEPFPERMFTNIESWHKHNPDYAITLWTDTPREIPLDYVAVKKTQTIPLTLDAQCREALSEREKMEILSYEILEKHGGIYVQFDVECHRSFDTFVSKFDFFAGAEDAWSWSKANKDYLKVSNAVFGSIPHHRFLQKTLKAIGDGWKKSTELVQQVSMTSWDLDDYLKKTLAFKRTFLPFTEVVLSELQGDRSVLLPPAYLGLMQSGGKGFFCTHYFEESWKPAAAALGQGSDVGLDKIREIIDRLNRTNRTTENLFLFCIVNVAFSVLILLAAIFIAARRKV